MAIICYEKENESDSLSLLAKAKKEEKTKTLFYIKEPIVRKLDLAIMHHTLQNVWEKKMKHLSVFLDKKEEKGQRDQPTNTYAINYFFLKHMGNVIQ